MTTFEDWLSQKKIKLKPWQLKSAQAFLKEMHPHRSPQTGKSFLARVLHAFVDECGNRYAVNTDEVKAERKRRGHEETLPGETL